MPAEIVKRERKLVTWLPVKNDPTEGWHKGFEQKEAPAAPLTLVPYGETQERTVGLRTRNGATFILPAHATGEKNVFISECLWTKVEKLEEQNWRWSGGINGGVWTVESWAPNTLPHRSNLPPGIPVLAAVPFLKITHTCRINKESKKVKIMQICLHFLVAYKTDYFSSYFPRVLVMCRSGLIDIMR